MSTVSRTVTGCFPFPQIRDSQRNVLEQTEQAILAGKKFIIWEAPTGFGKSPAAIAVAKFLGQSNILTATKDLQAQYTRDFPYLRLVKGRNNFECIDAYERTKENFKIDLEEEVTADEGLCVLDSGYKCPFKVKMDHYTKTSADKDHPENERIEINGLGETFLMGRKPCDYYQQKWIALKASHSLYNYKYFLALVQQAKRMPDSTGNITKKKLLVLDEAHLLEEELKDYYGLTVSTWQLHKVLPTFNFKVKNIPEIMYDTVTWIPVLQDLRNKLMEYVDNHTVVEGDKEREQKRLNIFCNKLIDKLGILLFELDDPENNNWIVGRVECKDNKYKDKITNVTFLPLSVGKYCREVFKYGDIVLMMSATILSKDNFCRMVGLREDEVEFIQVDSEFPVVNRPIYCLNVGRLNASTIEATLPKIAERVDSIMTRYKDVKGIVHTTSYKQLVYIRDHISPENKARLMETGEDIKREVLVRAHIDNPKPSVLISPSFHTGLDLKDDSSRFQIIVKVPYPDLTDRWIKKKMERDNSWYTWRTCLTLVQAYGRSVRSKDDYADTYILDSAFTEVFMWQAKRMLPKWFLNAIFK